MLREFTHLTEKLKDPEYLHLLLEPIMIWGLGIGLIAFLFAFFFGERKMQMVALAVIVISALAVGPYLDQRAQADERVVKLRGDVKELIEESQERRRGSRGAYMLVAALAGLTMLMGAHKGLPGMLAGIGTAVVGTVVVIHGAWLHLKDAEIYHPNIRVVESAAPAPAPKKGGGAAAGEARAKEPAGETRPVATTPREPVDGRRALNVRPR
ncbi:MAG: hypothetical protein ACR2RV_27060 [Verrucomicrobiales bacterium]